MSGPEGVTGLLLAWEDGDRSALERLLPIVDAELRQLARRHMAHEPAGHTLQPTALINEAFIRLVDSPRIDWRNRAHFFAMAARLMRRILVDHARAKRNLKRGGRYRRVPLSEARDVGSHIPPDLVALDEALQQLAAIDSRRSQVVELRYFAGLGVDETAEVLKISPETVMRDWKLAKAWLERELRRAERA
jgi:RNA polymerase sigma-70 factor, ECF subfamily